jgi:UDP-N-acetylglucosamine--N-acetylmuramyl-(pentapeptide) pyrophosphoryl-undecaprenol N-acetylglucosamine transferase
MSGGCFFFAGGGTGGHIYPAIAVAEQIRKLEPTAKIHFFCSTRSIDAQILQKAGIEYTPLPAKGLSFRPGALLSFCTTFWRSYRIAKEIIASSENPTIIGIGGFVAAPACKAAYKLKVPVKLLNVDIVPGRANRLIAKWADEIFVQFEDTIRYLPKFKDKINVVGCPLRDSFCHPQQEKAIEQLGLDKGKKILLITGASSGSENINNTICSLLDKLSNFTDDWQIVHLAGRANFQKVSQKYAGAKLVHKVIGYYDEMQNLLAAADLVIGRSGAVSVAEYAAAGVPSICMPYPYHKDRHQYLNAGKLVEAGAAIIVDDVPDAKDRAEWLWEELQALMKDEKQRKEMSDAGRAVAHLDAGRKIAERLTKIFL